MLKLDGNAVCKAIAVVRKVVGSAPEHVLFRTTKGGQFEIRARAESAICSVTIDAEVTEALRFSLPLDRMDLICRKRNLIEFILPQPALLQYKQVGGSYGGEIFLTDPVLIELTLPKTEAVPIKALLRDVMPFIDIVPLIPHDVLAFFRCKGGTLHAAAGDNHHAVMVTTPVESDDFELTLPLKYQKLLGTLFKDGYKLLVDHSSMYAVVPGIVVQLPLVDVGDVTFEKIAAYFATLNPTFGFVVNGNEFGRTLTNLGSTFDLEQKLRLVASARAKTLNIVLESKVGKATEKLTIAEIQGDKTPPVHMSVPLLKDVVSRLKFDQVTTGFVENKLMVMTYSDPQRVVKFLIQAVYE